MIKSMTGFGRAESRAAGKHITAELRSVNHRFAEFSIRLPRQLAGLEPRIKEHLQQRIRRGSVTLVLTRNGGERQDLPTINHQAASHYHRLLTELKKRYQLAGGVELATLASFSDIFTSDREALDDERAWSAVKPVIDRALADLDRMRAAEGKRLAIDLNARLAVMERTVGGITAMAPRRAGAFRDQLRARLRKLGVAADPDKLAQELAAYADRVDVTEECVRLRSHIKAWGGHLRGSEPAGRRLEFLLQEMNREANTIGAKAGDAAISQLAVGLKEDIEKLREQSQNIE